MPVLRTCRQHGGMFDFKPQLESDTPPSCRRSLRDRWHRQKDKNRSPSAKHTTLLPLQNTHHVPAVEVIVFHILVGFFAVKRRAVFVLGVVWVSPRKRVTVGLCGLRHGNEFPMTQSAQSHRQMRSIPHCVKDVFYVFVLDSIDDSTTVHNLWSLIFH